MRPRTKHGQGDPATSERLYSAEELELLKAVDAKSRKLRRPLRTREIFEVVKSLGYRRDGCQSCAGGRDEAAGEPAACGNRAGQGVRGGATRDQRGDGGDGGHG